MQYSSGYTTAFDAGHRYTVSVTWDREGAAGLDLDAFRHAQVKIEALAFELADRSLPKMLGPHHPSAFGIASFFMERLAINLKVTKVEVHESGSDIRAIIEGRSDF